MKLTREEIGIVVFVLVALTLGVAVKHWRDARRIAPLMEQAKGGSKAKQ